METTTSIGSCRGYIGSWLKDGVGLGIGMFAVFGSSVLLGIIYTANVISA